MDEMTDAEFLREAAGYFTVPHNRNRLRSIADRLEDNDKLKDFILSADHYTNRDLDGMTLNEALFFEMELFAEIMSIVEPIIPPIEDKG